MSATASTAEDWAGVGIGESGVRALLAEGVTAEIAERAAPGRARWHGGQTPGFDVKTLGEDGTEVRRDAKSVKVDKQGNIVLARFNGESYDSTKVDLITLVQMGEATTGFAIDLAAHTAHMEGTAAIVAVWELPVADINRLLPGLENGRNYRNVLLSPEDLEPYRVALASTAQPVRSD